ncbi:hypothetical protein P0R31_15725 [Bradyrhizobium yuanmingense]|uniref:hypothetical protein n=1 Tax=Bradyrhizobium yuanmingense TaxID=108015 RepID=UPI0023B999C6|nr:hypothetical protein [Bradyrhizobium yuanmingense]MDF0518680.1 hypothetical protein [Bradyrhizobium yuanmingense]
MVLHVVLHHINFLSKIAMPFYCAGDCFLKASLWWSDVTGARLLLPFGARLCFACARVEDHLAKVEQIGGSGKLRERAPTGCGASVSVW